jgi:hypothetical protein
MAIRGSLSEFSVPEILQLLALQQKSGVLALTHEAEGSRVMFFERGKVLAAAERRQTGRNAFLRHLSISRLLTDDQLESVEDICQATGHDLFTVLVSSGVLGRDRLQDEMRRYAQLGVDEVIGWREGTYEFSGDEKSLPSQGITVKLNPEELLLETMRRNDELATLKESMLAPDLILAKVRNADSVPLPHEALVVTGLVNGQRTIDEICAESPLGEYLTYDTISELLSSQQIMIVDPSQAVRVGPRRAKRTPFVWTPVLAALSLMVGSALLGIGLHPLLSRTSEDQDWLPREAVERRAEVRANLEAEVALLRASIDRRR